METEGKTEACPSQLALNFWGELRNQLPIQVRDGLYFSGVNAAEMLGYCSRGP